MAHNPSPGKREMFDHGGDCRMIMGPKAQTALKTRQKRGIDEAEREEERGKERDGAFYGEIAPRRRFGKTSTFRLHSTL